MIRNSMKETLENSLDGEWIELVLNAKSVGLTPVEVESLSTNTESLGMKKFISSLSKNKRN